MMDQEQESIFSLQVDPAGQAALAESARWGKFLSILGFIVCGLIVLSMLFVLAVGSTSALGGATGGAGLAAVVIYLVMAAVYFIPCVHLYNYSRNVGSAIATNNQDVMTGAFVKLKSFFKFVGIMAIVAIALFVMGVVYFAIMLGGAIGAGG